MSKHNFIVTATVARLILALLLAIAIHHSFFISIALLIFVLVADLLDGVWARKNNVDSNIRRSVDGAVDMLSVFIVATSFLITNPQYITIYIPLLVSDTLSATICSVSLVRRKILLIGDKWHKISSLSKAILFFFLLYGEPEFILVSAYTTWVINYVLTIDYVGAYLVVVESHNQQVKRMIVRNLLGV